MKAYSKLSLSWIRSITMIVIIILSLCSVLLAYDLLLLRRTILESMGDMTEYLQHSMDSQFLELQKIASTIELNGTNSRTKKGDQQIGAISHEQYAFSQMISTFTLTNQALTGIFVYYPPNRMIIGNEGVFPARSYFALENNLKTDGYEEWRISIENAENGFIQLPAGDESQFCYVKKMQYQGQTVGFILFRLDPLELLRPTESLMKEDPNRLTFGIMLNNRIVSLSGDNPRIPALLEGRSFSDGVSTTFSSQRYLVHIRASQLPDLHYLNAYFLPHSLQPMILPLLICILGIFIIGIFGTILSIKISRKNLEPVQSILSKLGKTPRMNMDEYEMINSRIDTLLNEQDTRGNKLHIQQNMIGGLFLNMLLNTDMQSEGEIFNIAKRYDISFENPYYIVGVIKVLSREKQSLVQPILDWLETRQIEGTVFYLNDKYILLLNLEDPLDSHELIPLLESLLKEDFWNRPHIAGLGSCSDTLASISTSYMEAMTALHETAMIQPGMAVVYRRGMIQKANETGNMHFEHITEALSQKAFVELRRSFELFFAHYSSRSDTLSEFKQNFAPLQALLEDTGQTTDLSLDEIASPFFCYDAPRQLRLNILAYLDQLENAFSDSPRQKGPGLTEKAKTIIHRDYTDSLLGLYRIAEELGVSNSYLSTTFKNTFGVGIVQYINQLRIDLAKELILTTSMNIKEIAMAVGFSSDISFIRVFKKYEARTPNTLRKG